MNKFLLISFLSTAISISCFAQVSHPRQQVDNNNIPARIEFNKAPNREQSMGRPTGQMENGNQPAVFDRNAVPNSDVMPVMERPGRRNDRIINLKLNRNPKISNLLRDRQKELKDRFGDDTRGIGQYLISGYANAGVNLVSSIVDDAINAGLNALVKVFKGHHDEWRQMNQKENVKKDSIVMTSQVNDFYSNFSTEGALDPSGLQFDGVTLEKKANGRTIFKLVTHLDTSKEGLDKILGHSKFSLIIDTLYFDIKNSGLPNRENAGHDDPNDVKFSFDTRRSISEKITLSITSSYISPAIEVFNDVKLGSFDINLSSIEAKDTLDGCIYEYYRDSNQNSDKEPVITGECFIVPRSYNGMRNPETNEYRQLYGLGEYKVDAILITSCQNTPEFEENWKTDWRAYKERQKSLKNGKAPRGGDGNKKWYVQYFNQNYKSWMTTVITAPINSSKSYLQRIIQEETGVNQMGGMQGGGMQGGGMNGMQGGGMNDTNKPTNNQQGQPNGNNGGEMPPTSLGQGGPQGNGNPPIN